MKHFRLITIACIALLTVSASHAQTFKTILQFNGTNGEQASSALIQGPNGQLFGTIIVGGKYGVGTIFEITPSGVLTDIYDFCPQAGCSDGANPNAPLLLASDGNFYGTTNGGGAHEGGTIFKIIPSTGQLVTIYSFCSLSACDDGQGPGPIVQGRNGHLYGTTQRGGTGSHCSTQNCGTIFEVTLSGTLTTLHNFCSLRNCPDGYQPYGVTLGTDGNFYGTAQLGGPNGDGTIFVMNPAGQLSVLHQFTGSSDGFVPNPVIQANDGNFYGTTRGGGSTGDNGIVFQITPQGQFTTIYSFCALSKCVDGQGPEEGLTLGSDGNLYGTTYFGGAHQSCGLGMGCGTVFQITTAGALTTLYSFCPTFGCPDGSDPVASVVQRTDGNFYGTTSAGASTACNSGCGTVFGLSTGLAPFVEAVPSIGKVGYTVRILGNGLTGTAGVTFNGTPATFTVFSNTLIKATVPTGATTGTIQVTTPGGVLSSNVAFQVLP